MITYGTNPGMVMPIGGLDPERARRRRCSTQALAYMGLHAGEPIGGQPVNVVFIGSCTNARLVGSAQRRQRAARPQASPRGVRMLVVPGSQQVKRAAEAEGWTGCSSRPAPSGASRAARCASA